MLIQMLYFDVHTTAHITVRKGGCLDAYKDVSIVIFIVVTHAERPHHIFPPYTCGGLSYNNISNCVSSNTPPRTR